MKVLVSPTSFGQISSEPYEILKKNGFEIVKNPYGRKITESEVIELGKSCVGIIAGVEPITKKVIDALPDLKLISRVGVGMDSIDLDYAAEKGIVVRNTPDAPTRSVAELTLALTFALLRKIPRADRNVRAGVWKKEVGNLLQGKVIGIFGLGRIGRMTAELFRTLGNNVIGFDIKPDEEWAKNNNIDLLSKNDLFKNADIITLHVPPVKGQDAMISASELNMMKENAMLVNVARGGVVDEDILFDLLKNGKIAGAAIDVFSEEPYKGKFTELENTVLTPHLGSYAAEGKLRMELDAVNNFITSIKSL